MFSEIDARIAVASAYDAVPSGWAQLDVRGLVDGPGNSPALIDQYIERGLEILKTHDAKVLVVCDHGQSRSNFIAAHLYMRLHQSTWDAAKRMVSQRHPDSKMHSCFLDNLLRPSANITRIAISGAQGMLGTAVSNRLTKIGYDCRLLSRQCDGNYLANSDAIFTALDEYKPDLFLHLAHPKPYNSETTTQVAMAQLASVVWYCEKNAVRLLFPSSWVVFDGSSLDSVNNTSQVSSHTRYGRLKVACEAYLSECRQQGVAVKVVRIPGVFGTESLDPRFLRYFADCVRAHESIVVHRFHNGYARVPLIAIDDAADLLADVINDFDKVEDILHIGTNEQTPTVQEIASRIADEFHLKLCENLVDRTVFRGAFLADRHGCSDASSADKISDFISHLI